MFLISTVFLDNEMKINTYYDTMWGGNNYTHQFVYYKILHQNLFCLIHKNIKNQLHSRTINIQFIWNINFKSIFMEERISWIPQYRQQIK